MRKGGQLEFPVAAVCFIFAMILDERVVSASTTEFYLKKNLTAIYDPTNRPVLNHNSTVGVKIDIALQQIISLFWKDEHLQWEPGEWDGITRTNFEPHSIWFPDVQIVNYAAERPIDNDHFGIEMKNTGEAKWMYQAIVKSTCNVNVQYFPYDTQRCNITFSSWTFQIPQLNMTSATPVGDTSVFIRNGEWHLIEMPASREELFTSCCKSPWSMITYEIVIERRPLYYVYNLMVPCVCLLGTAMTGFLLPPESGEKLSLGVTILLALTVFLLLVAEITPTQSEVIPLLGQFFGISIMLQTFSTAMNVVVINVHCRGGHNVDVPPWLRLFAFCFLARIFCRRKEVEQQLKHHHDKRQSMMVRLRKVSVDETDRRFLSNHDSMPEVKQRSNSPSKDSPSASSLHKTVVKIDEKLSDYLRDAERQDLHHTEWRLVAVLIDRLLLVLFLMVVATVLCLFLLKPPK